MLATEIAEAAVGHACQAEEQRGAVGPDLCFMSRIEASIDSSPQGLREGNTLLMRDTPEPFMLLWSELYLGSNHDVMMS